jgi:hypothetical protein
LTESSSPSAWARRKGGMVMLEMNSGLARHGRLGLSIGTHEKAKH